MKKSVLLGALLALPFAAAAEGISYNHIDLSYDSFDIDGDIGGLGVDGDGDGWTIGGTFAVSDLVFLEASYSDGDADVKIGGVKDKLDVEATHVGIGLHSNQFTGGVDIYGILGYADDGDDDGFGIEIGARTLLSPNFEGNISYAYSDIGDGTDAFGIGGVYLVNPNWGVTFGYDYATSEGKINGFKYDLDSDGFNIGVRYDFQS